MEVGALRSGDPERLGSYALIGRIGEGGQGAVFLGSAEDGRRVAVKLLHAELTSDEKARARFLRELEVAKRVAPFCTAQVIDADVEGDLPYIASEYVDGPSLNQQVLAEGPLPGAALERLAVGTATALAAIHQGKIIHRDFKPHNVLIGPDGPRVIDFGVARAISGSSTLTSRVIGTPSYMAPEQIRGEEIGTAADVFCWAATLTFAATGAPPFGQDTIPAVINRILHEEPELGDLDGALRALVLDCLDKDPARRPNARQLLMRLLGHDEQAAPAAVVADDAHDHDDATAILAVGSVVAAELELGEDGADEVATAAGGVRGTASSTGTQAMAALPTRDGDPERLPTPAEWAAQNTLPPDAAPLRKNVLARAITEPSRKGAALAGVAALLIAVVITSAALALGGDDKQSRKVSDPAQRAVPSSAVPSTSQASRPAYVPQQPSASATASPTPTETGSPTPTGGPTTSGPTGKPTDKPTDPPTDKPTDPPTDPPTDTPTDTPTEPGTGNGTGGEAAPPAG